MWFDTDLTSLLKSDKNGNKVKQDLGLFFFLCSCYCAWPFPHYLNRAICAPVSAGMSHIFSLTSYSCHCGHHMLPHSYFKQWNSLSQPTLPTSELFLSFTNTTGAGDALVLTLPTIRYYCTGEHFWKRPRIPHFWSESPSLPSREQSWWELSEIQWTPNRT